MSNEGQLEINVSDKYANAFTVDFWDKKIILNGKPYPAGHFALQIINLSDHEINEIFDISLPVMQFHHAIGTKKEFYIDEFEPARIAMYKIFELVCKFPPLSLLDNNMRKDYFDILLQNESILQAKNHLAIEALGILNMHEEKQKTLTISQEASESSGYDALIYLRLCELLGFYGYFAVDCYNFWMAGRSFASHIEKSVYSHNASFLAKESELFFADKNVNDLLDDFNPTKGHRRFGTSIDPVLQYVNIKHPTRKKQFVIAQRYYFHSFMDFLTADFYAGIAHGHYPKCCKICGKYFLAKDARNQLYCDGYDPNDPKGRTCRKVGQDRKRIDRKKEETLANPIKRLCSKRLNTIRTHVARGIITEEFADKAKAYVQTLKARALRNHDYYISGEYEKDISQESVYDAVKNK